MALQRRAVGAATARMLGMPPGRHPHTVTRTRVPMSDGVELMADLYAPERVPLGTVLIRTPYGRDGLIAHLTAGCFASHGYHVVNQSWRGTSGSGGSFEPFGQETADGADTVAWLRRQTWFGGVVEVVHQTDNPHADLFARLCEVAANGRSINVSDGFRRLDPEKASGTIRLQLEATAHRFTPGARIRLQLSGGAHPRYARNLGTDQDPATSSDLAPSRRKIFHGDGGFSRLLLPCPTRRRGGPAGRSAQDARGARLGEWGRRWR